MMVGWTTTATRDDALRLAQGLIGSDLAACAQVDGPITSVYRWEGRVEESAEFRVTVKFLRAREPAVQAWLTAHHPYETPQWICVAADAVAKNYLNWAGGNST